MFIETATVTIALGLLFASAFSAAFGFGGIFILVGMMSLVLPVEAILPLQSAVMMGSQLSRATLLWRHINWSFAKSFFIGFAIGAPLGAFVYQYLSASAVALILAAVLLYVAWAPPMSSKLKIPFGNVTIAAIHSTLSTAFSFGGLIQGLLFRQGFDRFTITATLAVTVFVMTLFKIPAYAVFGFDYSPYLSLIIVCWLLAPIGTWIGKRFLFAMPETVFQYGYKILLTAVAIRLIWVAL